MFVFKNSVNSKTVRKVEKFFEGYVQEGYVDKKAYNIPLGKNGFPSSKDKLSIENFEKKMKLKKYDGFSVQAFIVNNDENTMGLVFGVRIVYVRFYNFLRGILHKNRLVRIQLNITDEGIELWDGK